MTGIQAQLCGFLLLLISIPCLVEAQSCRALANHVVKHCDDGEPCSAACGTAIDEAKAAGNCMDFDLSNGNSNSTNNGTATGKKLSVEIDEFESARVDCGASEPEPVPASEPEPEPVPAPAPAEDVCGMKLMQKDPMCKDFGDEAVRQKFEDEGACPKLKGCGDEYFGCMVTEMTKKGAAALAHLKGNLDVRCDICRKECLDMLALLGVQEKAPLPSVPAKLKFDGVDFKAFEAKSPAEKATFKMKLRDAIAKQLAVPADSIFGLKLSSGSVIVDFMVEYKDQAAADAGKEALAQKLEDGLDVTELTEVFKTVDPNAAPVLDKAASEIKAVTTPPVGGEPEPEPAPVAEPSAPGETPAVDSAARLGGVSLLWAVLALVLVF